MKKVLVLFTTLLVIAFAFLTVSCSLLGDPIAEKVADVVGDYCKEPLRARQLYRDTVNQALAIEGHSIEVTCAGDPEEVTRADPRVSPAGDPAAAELLSDVRQYVCDIAKHQAMYVCIAKHQVQRRDPGGAG